MLPYYLNNLNGTAKSVNIAISEKYIISVRELEMLGKENRRMKIFAIYK